jgi:alkylation response protein AidB-like acyl-CoA dehydrogenase
MAQQQEVMARALALQELVREEAPRTESQGNLTAPVVQALLNSEMFYLMVPAALGGLEVDGRTYLEVIETISAADGSTGWCVMIGVEINGMLGVNLPEDVARRILFQHGPICCGGSAIQDGTATIEKTGDHYRVSGRWRFASGCNHSAYLFAFAPLYASGQPVMQDNAPTILMPFMAREDLEFHDTWHVSGLRGTGSVDFTAKDVSVKPEMVVSFGQAPLQSTTMFRLPLGPWFAMGKAAVATGIARGAIDECLTLLTRTPSFSTSMLRDEARIQLQIADAEASLRAARAFLYDALQDAWNAAEQGRPVTTMQSAILRLASVHAAKAACEAVELAYHAAGSVSLFEASPLQRALRDVHAVRQHMMVADRYRQDVGRVLLGLEPQESLF